MQQPRAEALRQRPPERALRWTVRAAGAERVTRVRRLPGGTSSAVHAVTVEDTAGERRTLVLRRFVLAGVVRREPDLPAREAGALRLLAASGLPAPALVAADVDGAESDVPAVLMTRLSGRVELAPDALERRLPLLAGALVRLHALPLPATGVLPRYRPWVDLARVALPRWTERRGAWTRLLEAVRHASPPPATAVVLHRDFHPGNLLWTRGRLSGIADWVNACVGPAPVDVAHCARNVAMLLGVEGAERFRLEYERRGRRAQPPYWDALSLLELGPEGPDAAPNVTQWHDLGRRDLTREACIERLDAYAALVASRL